MLLQSIRPCSILSSARYFPNKNCRSCVHFSQDQSGQRRPVENHNPGARVRLDTIGDGEIGSRKRRSARQARIVLGRNGKAAIGAAGGRPRRGLAVGDADVGQFLVAGTAGVGAGESRLGRCAQALAVEVEREAGGTRTSQQTSSSYSSSREEQA